MLIIVREGEVQKVKTGAKSSVTIWSVKNGFDDTFYKKIPENYEFMLGPFLNDSLFNIEIVGNATIEKDDLNYRVPKKNADYDSVYSSFYYDSDTPLVKTISTAGTWVKVSFASLTERETKGLSIENDKCVVKLGSGGMYRISYQGSYDTEANLQTNKGAIFINGEKINGGSSRTKLQQSTSALTSSSETFIRLYDGDTIEFMVTSDLDGAVLNVYNYNLTINRVGS